MASIELLLSWKPMTSNCLKIGSAGSWSRPAKVPVRLLLFSGHGYPAIRVSHCAVFFWTQSPKTCEIRNASMTGAMMAGFFGTRGVSPRAAKEGFEQWLLQPPQTTRNQHGGLIRLGLLKGARGVGKGYFNPQGGRIYLDLGDASCIATNRGSYDYIMTRGPSKRRPVVVRKPHIRELRRLQGFPEDFTQNVGIYSAYRQIGNAIPPRMVQFLGNKIMSDYFGASKKTI